jgi:hypothetical protein
MRQSRRAELLIDKHSNLDREKNKFTIDLAKSGLILKVRSKGRSAEIFKNICPSPIL